MTRAVAFSIISCNVLIEIGGIDGIGKLHRSAAPKRENQNLMQQGRVDWVLTSQSSRGHWTSRAR